ncbi:hypothetical protein [Rhodococcus qingshengii]|uniref:hypothetical protein n=1 Tax=Rhodococcus qingshengii TaxID=334542 RepID=UPI0035DDFD7F
MMGFVVSGFPVGGVTYLSLSAEVPESEPVFIVQHPYGDAVEIFSLERLQEVAQDVHDGDLRWDERIEYLYIVERGNQLDRVRVRLDTKDEKTKIILTGNASGSVWEYEL